MSNEEKLDALYRMTLENHEILKSIRRQQYFANATKVIYWLVVLGALGGAYYYVRPFVGMISGNSSRVQETFDQLNQLRDRLPETKAIDNFLEGTKTENVPAQ